MKFEDNSVKRAAKGIPIFNQETLSYEKYNDIYTGEKRAENITVTTILSENAKLELGRVTRRDLFFMVLKRYYFDNDHSVTYGHPSIPTPMEGEPTSPSSTTRAVKRPRDDRSLMFETNKRHKAAIEAVLKRHQV